MKKEYAMYRRTYLDVRGSKFVTRTADPVLVRVLARAEGYAMIRELNGVMMAVPEEELEAL